MSSTTTPVPWNEIPHHELGTAPEGMDDRMYRLVIAKRAIVASYEESDNPEQCIRDLLSDIRHLCDALELGFEKLDRMAHDAYLSELRGEW